jgi:hypothetical protein
VVLAITRVLTPAIAAPCIVITGESGKENLGDMVELRERAQGLVEYGLIIALVAVLAIAGLIIFGPAVSSLLSRLGGSV